MISVIDWRYLVSFGAFRNFYHRDNKPDDVLIEFLEKKSTSVQDRVFEATGIKIKKPVYYSAECNYNINELLDLLINNMPKEKRKLTI